MARHDAPNPFVGRNYLPDQPSMEIPPAYFLQRIWDQDSMLVVLPSRKVPFAYVIARRKQFSKGLTDKALLDTCDQPDTKMCMLYDLVPVCLIHKTGSSWNPDPVIRSLQARDLWAHGGADKVSDMLEEQEAAEKKKIQAETRDDLWNRSGDAYRSYKHRTGQTTIRSKDFHKPRQKRRTNQTASSTSESTSGSGIVLARR